MKLVKIILIIFTLYISAYSKDILRHYSIMNDRILNIPIENVKIEQNNSIIFSEEEKNILNEKLYKVKQLLIDGNFFDAIELCNNLEVSYSNYYEIYYLRADAYFKRGDLYYASLDFTKLLSLNIDKQSYDLVFKSIGNFFDTINEYEMTLKAYIIAYKITNNAYWLFLAANSSLKNGDIKSANYYFNLCGNTGYSKEGKGDIDLVNDNYNSAIKNYRNARYSNQEDISRVKNKISNAMIKKEIYNWNINFEKQNYTNALNILNNVSSNASKYPEIYVALGKTYFEMHDYQTAKSILTKAISIDKNFDEAYCLLTQIYLYENNESEAMKIMLEGLEYCYYKPRLYETFSAMLYDLGYSYYPSKIISQIMNIYDISDENKLSYSKHLILEKKYDEAEKLLKSITIYSNIANELIKSISYNKILDKAQELKIKEYYVDIMLLLSLYKFTGYEEQRRIGYISESYYKLGSIDKSIDILKEAFDANIISVNNVLLLRELLEIRGLSKDTSSYQKERDIIDIEATFYFEEELKLHTNLITDRIYDFIRFNKYDDALEYIITLREKDYPIDYIKKIESTIYGFYAAYLYENKNYDDANKIISLAIRRNVHNYDAIAIKNEMYINDYLTSFGIYDNLNAYIELSSVMREVLRVAPAYIENRIKLALALAREYNIEGFNIVNNIVKYINVYGGKDLLLGRIYNKAYLYTYSMSAYNRASNHLKVKPIYIADSIINIDNYDLSYDYISKMLNDNINNAEGLYAVSKLYLKIRNYEDALNTINNAIILDNNNINYIYQKAYINELIGKTKEALNDYEYILKIKRNFAIVNYRASIVALNNFKDSEKAETYALNYLALVSNDYSGYDLLGDIFMARSQNYIDSDTNNLLKNALLYYNNAMKKAVWGRDNNVRDIITDKINFIKNKIL